MYSGLKDLTCIKSHLSEFGQEHLLKFYDELSEKEAKKLLNQIQSIDFGYLKTIFDASIHNKKAVSYKTEELEPCPPEIIGDTESPPHILSSWWDEGLKAISESEAGILLLAGGQGTRLGVTYPKGMYKVDIPSKRSLFSLQGERIFKLKDLASKKYGSSCSLPWYIMTSETTEKETRTYFETENYFGLPPKDVILFEQNVLPCLTNEGKVIMSSKSSISFSPNGNGGLYEVLGPLKIIEDMKNRGLKYIHIYGVDNILVRPGDPYFIGFCKLNNYDCCAKVVRKQDPDESLGVVCRINNAFEVVEYSEINNEVKKLRHKDTNHLVFDEGNICNHLITVDGLDKIINNHIKDLPYHVAHKMVDYFDESGNLRSPDSPNAVKLERFIFDIFPYFKKFGVFRAVRDEEFSPLKNGPSKQFDSPDSCRKDLLTYHTKLISKHAKLTHPEKLASIEISASLTYAGEGLEMFDGVTINNSEPTYISTPPSK